MSLDSNHRTIKKHVREYFCGKQNDSSTTGSGIIDVVITLKGSYSEDYNKFLKVTAREVDVRLVKETIQDNGECLLVNENLGNKYFIDDITYIEDSAYNHKASVVFRDGALYFRNNCSKSECEYTQCTYDLYNYMGELIHSAVPINTTVGNQCMLGGRRLSILNNNGTSDMVESVVIVGKIFPCTDYDRTLVELGDMRDNLVVNLTLNSGDTCDVIISKKDYDLLIKNLEDKAVFVDKQVLYIIDCKLVMESYQAPTCYMNEDKLYLISSKGKVCSTSHVDKCFSYDIVLDDGSIINICCKNKLDRTTFKYLSYGTTLRIIKGIYYVGMSAFAENVASIDSDTIITKYTNIPIYVTTSESEHFNCCVTLPDYVKLVDSGSIFYFTKDNNGEVSEIKPSKVCYSDGCVDCVVSDRGIVTALLMLNK